MKPWYRARTFWAIILTFVVVAAQQYAPDNLQDELKWLQTLLVGAGLWFARISKG